MADKSTAAYAIVLTTCGDRESARQIAKSLVERRLAACVQMLPIESLYEWAGKVEEATEVLLLCKVKRADYAEVEKAIGELHDYQVPEIVEVPIERGLADYLSWIDKVTR